MSGSVLVAPARKNLSSAPDIQQVGLKKEKKNAKTNRKWRQLPLKHDYSEVYFIHSCILQGILQ